MEGILQQMPQITIIIPAKNEEDNIGSCLNSIFAINYAKEQYEVILVDNGSSDKTVEIARSKGAKVFIRPDDKISAMRNFGAKQARGRILAFLDADCTVKCDWLKRAEQYFSDTDTVCFGSAPEIPEHPTWVQRTWYLVRKNSDDVAETKWLESMNMFVRKDIFETVGGFNEKLVTCEDVDLSYRLAAHGKIISDPRIKAVHHGEAKDLSEFFKKECWRGKSNYLGLKEHGLKLAEIPSLILPLYFLTLALISIALLLSGQWQYSVLAIIIWQLPLVSISLLKTYRSSSLNYLPKLYLLYNVYYIARGIATFR